MLVVNCYPVVLLTKQILQSFKKRWTSNKTKSFLGNTGGLFSQGSAELISTLCASKIFVNFVTNGLSCELNEFGVDVSCWTPAVVQTKMTAGIIKDDPLACTAAELAESCLKKCTNRVHGGFWKHTAISLFLDCGKDLFPWFGDFALAKIVKEFKNKANSIKKAE